MTTPTNAHPASDPNFTGALISVLDGYGLPAAQEERLVAGLEATVGDRHREFVARAIEAARTKILPPVQWNINPRTGVARPGTSSIDKMYRDVERELTRIADACRTGEAPMAPADDARISAMFRALSVRGGAVLPDVDWDFEKPPAWRYLQRRTATAARKAIAEIGLRSGQTPTKGAIR